MSRHFRWNEPGDDGQNVVQEITDDEIIRTYFPYWSDQMRKVGKSAQISPNACLEDFMAVHWAWEVQP
jgi:hypothetical protein